MTQAGILKAACQCTISFRLPGRKNKQNKQEREEMRVLSEPCSAQGLHLFSLVLIVTCIVFLCFVALEQFSRYAKVLAAVLQRLQDFFRTSSSFVCDCTVLTL